MNVLKPFLNPKKLRKLQNNPQAFFKDALDKRIIPIQNQLKSLKPKKKHAFAEYYIISAVYNVEKYLEDYFNSILKQRLDFKNNIKIICVDDGSTDDSAKIIKQYQSKYPNNIFYLHKENGGQASARNLGLQWLQERLGYAVETEAMRHCEQSEAIHNPANQNTNHFVIARATPEAIHNAESRNEDSIVEAKGEISDNGLPQDSNESLAMTKSYQMRHCEQSEAIHNPANQNTNNGIAKNNGEISDNGLPQDSNESLAMTQSKSHKPVWVTFTDPDDFLDRDYFYEVDKFLEENTDKDICMVGCNLIFYYEAKNAFSDSHPLKYKFKNGMLIRQNRNLNEIIQLSAATAFLELSKIPRNLYFDEDLKPNFEDAKFVNEFLMAQMESQSAFLKDAKYYYREREKESSTLDRNGFATCICITNQTINLTSFLSAIQKQNKYIPNFIQYAIICHYYSLIDETINNNSRFTFYTSKAREDFLRSLDDIFSYIDTPSILKFNIGKFRFFHRVGILNCFKKEYPPFQITYIEAFDAVKRQILIRYFTPDAKDIESFRIDGEEVYADVEKIVQNDFLDRVFCYEKRLWVHIPQNSNELEIFVRGQRARITFGGKQHQSLKIKSIDDRFQQLLNPNTLWLLMDRDTEADDNAEHFYRYIAKNYPKQNIVFALRRESKDWTRLQKEGFRLIDFGGVEFNRVAQNAQKYISSHSNGEVIRFFDQDKTSSIFLQHGVTKDDVSKWLNQRNISVFITTTQAEHDSIYKNFNHYKFGLKEVSLMGFARHDSLFYKAQNLKPKKLIFIMLTWRKQLGTLTFKDESVNITQSEYFLKYNSLLQSKKLEQLCMYYDYKVVFNPHPYIKGCLSNFNLPQFISLKLDSQSIQELFCESALMITDYSSVAFEMAYLKKPVLYYQFDEEEFFANHSYQKGYFDYRKDGFGPVVTTEEDLLQELEILLKNDCKVGEPYKSNIENTFEFRDGKCCERIYQAILELDKPYERKWTLDYVLNLAQNALNAECYKEASERFRFVLEHLGDNERVGLTALSLRGEAPLSSLRGSEANEAIHNVDNQNTNHFVIARATPEAIHNQTYLKDSIAESRVDKINDELNEEIIFNYLYASRLNQTSQEALEFLKAQDYENKLAFSNKVKFEIIKNYIEILDAQEVITRLEDLKEAIPQTELLEFAYLKLRIYAYLGDKAKLKEVYNELKNTYNIDKKDLDLDLFLFQNELIKAASLQTATASAGGGGFL